MTHLVEWLFESVWQGAVEFAWHKWGWGAGMIALVGPFVLVRLILWAVFG